MAEKARYVDADKLIDAIRGIYVNTGSHYSSGAVDSQINSMISHGITEAMQSLKMALACAIDNAAESYDKCMLCVQKDSCIPPHPLGDNR
jgi:hypothetical protein